MKLRREGSVSRADYNDVRSKVDSVRSEARGVAMGSSDVRQGNATWQGSGSGAGSGSGSGTGYGTGTSGTGGVYGGTTDATEPAQPAGAA